MAKSIIPEFKLNLDQPRVDPFTDFSMFSESAQKFLQPTTPAESRILKVGYGDAASMGQFSDMTSKFLSEQGVLPGEENKVEPLIIQNAKSYIGYTQDKLVKSTYETLGSIYNFPAALSRAFNVVYGKYIGNPIQRALGKPDVDWNKTFGEMIADKTGLSGIDTSGLKDGALKNIIDDAKSGVNVFYGISKRQSQGFEARAQQRAEPLVEQGHETAVNIIGTVSEAVPVSLQYLLPYGVAVGAASALSRNWTESLDAAKAAGIDSYRGLEKGTYLGVIDATSEMIFGAFGELSGMFVTPAGKIAQSGLKAFTEKLGSKTVGKILMTFFAFAGSAGEEGLEEAIAYPFSQYVNYRYDHPEGSIMDFKAYINPKDWINSFLLGTLSGALLGGGSMVSGVFSDVKNANAAKKLKQLGEMGAELVDMNPDSKGFESKAAEFTDGIAGVVSEANQEQQTIGNAVSGNVNVSAENKFRGRKLTTAPSAAAAPETKAAPAEESKAETKEAATPEQAPAKATEGKKKTKTAPATGAKGTKTSEAVGKAPAKPTRQKAAPGGATSTATAEAAHAASQPATEAVPKEAAPKTVGSTAGSTEEIVKNQIAQIKGFSDEDLIKAEMVVKSRMNKRPAATANYKKLLDAILEEKALRMASRDSKIKEVEKAVRAEYAKRTAETKPPVKAVPTQEEQRAAEEEREKVKKEKEAEIIKKKREQAKKAIESPEKTFAPNEVDRKAMDRFNQHVLETTNDQNVRYELVPESKLTGMQKKIRDLVFVSSGRKVLFIEKNVSSRERVGGFYTLESSGSIFINVRDATNQHLMITTIGHEMFHMMTQNHYIQGFKGAAYKVLGIKSDAEATQKYFEEYSWLTEEYKKYLIDNNLVVEEFLAERAEKVFFSSEFWSEFEKRYGEESKTIFQKVLAWLKKILQSVPGVGPEVNAMLDAMDQAIKHSPVLLSLANQVTDIKTTFSIALKQQVNWQRTGYYGTGNSDVDAALNESGDISNPKTLKDKLRPLIQSIKDMTLGAIRIAREYGDLRFRIEQFRNSGSIASSMIQLHIMGTYNKLNSEQYMLARNYVIFRDMMEDVKRGTFDPKGFPFVIKDVSDVEKYYKDADAAIHGSQNKAVLKAVEARDKKLDEIRQKLIRKAGLIGWDLQYLNSRNGYMVHAINEYLKEQAADKIIRRKRTVDYKAREGSEKNYMTDLATTDFIIMKQMMKDAARIDVVREIKKLDIYKSLENPDGTMKPMPEGYSELTMGDMGMNFNDQFQVAAKKAAAQAKIAKMKIDPKSKQAIKIMISAGKARSAPMIVPIQVRDAMIEEFRTKTDPHAVTALVRTITSAWKAEQLFAPTKIIKYNFRNMFGDTDALIMTYPKAFTKLNQARRDLLDLYRRGKANDMMKKYVEFGGLSMGLSQFDMDSLHLFDKFKFYPKQVSNGFNAAKAFKSSWNAYMKNAKGATEFREQLLRYSAFLYLNETLTADVNKGGKGLPAYYGASVPKEIQSISNISKRAFKLSQDALGNYQDVTMMGQSIAKTAWPFYRFVEVNAKRYFRAFKNSFYVDPNIGVSTGQQIVDKFGKGFKVTGMALLRLGRLGLLYGAYAGLLEFWNRIIMGEADDQLPEDIKKTSHITLGFINGKVRYVQDLSSFAQFYGYAGLEGQFPFYSDLKDIIEGRQTFKEKVEDILKAPVNTVISGLNPAIKLPFELGFGKTAYPDIFKSRPIRDNWEYAMKTVGFDNLYRTLFEKPQPGGNYFSSLETSLFNTVYVGDAALWNTYGIKEDFLRSEGEYNDDYFISKSPKSMAVYYYKTAIRLKDYDAARKYLQDYVNAGGTSKTFNLSMKYMDPLYGMKTELKNKFLQQMTVEEREQYDKAKKYVEELREAGRDIEAEIFTRGRQ